MEPTLENPRPIAPARFGHGDNFLHAVGDVALSRIVFDPWPGTATGEDLVRIGDQRERLCELVEHTLIEMPTGFYESVISGLLTSALVPFSDGIGFVTGARGPLRMKSGNVRLPGISFIRRERFLRGKIPRDAIVEMAPDLGAEVLRDGHTNAEIKLKLRDYFESGTQLAWIVDPRQKTVAVYHSPDQPEFTLSSRDELDGEHVLPGFKFKVSKLFQY